MTNILIARKGQKNKESNFWRKSTYCDQKHFGKDVFCASLSPNYNKCRSLYVHRAFDPLLPDHDQDQGNVGYLQLWRGAYLDSICIKIDRNLIPDRTIYVLF